MSGFLRTWSVLALTVLFVSVGDVAAGQADVRGRWLQPAPSRVRRKPDATTGPSPNVDALVQRALDRAPSLEAIRARLASVEAEAAAADVLPNPMVEFEYRAGGFPRYTIGSDPASMLGASVRQDLLSRGRRVARRRTASAAIVVGRVELDARRAELVAAVRTSYARLYAIDRETETLRDAADVLELLEATATARYAAGGADQASVIRTQLERSRLAERAADLGAERLTVCADLNRLTNDPPDTDIGRVTALPPAGKPAPGESQAVTVDDHAPRVEIGRAVAGVAQARVAEAREELRRAWSVGAGLYWMGGLDRVAVLSVGIDLPFRKNRLQRPRITAAERELDAARAELADEVAAVNAEARRLSVAWTLADEQVSRYRDAILPRSTAALDATRSSYLGGRSDFVAVLDEFRRWIDVRVGLARRETDRYVAAAELTALVGTLDVGRGTPDEGGR